MRIVTAILSNCRGTRSRGYICEIKEGGGRRERVQLPLQGISDVPSTIHNYKDGYKETSSKL